MTADEIAAMILRVVELLPYVFAIAAAVAAFTPTPKDDNFLRKVRRVVDLLGFNFKHAQNKELDNE